MSSHWTPVAVMLIGVIAGSCSSGPSAPPDDKAYVQEITEHRAQVDKSFREQPDNPIPPAMLDTLLPLRYYEVDPSYAVPAALKLADERPVFEMPTSTGKMRRMQRVGVLEFTLQDQPMTLGAFVEEGQAIETLFVPFADLGRAREELRLEPSERGCAAE